MITKSVQSAVVVRENEYLLVNLDPTMIKLAFWRLDEGFADRSCFVLFVSNKFPASNLHFIFMSFHFKFDDESRAMSWSRWIKSRKWGGRRSIMKFNLWLYNNIECSWHRFSFQVWLYKYLQSPQPPQYIYWQRNDRMVNYDDNRRDVSIETIPGPRTQSRLIIKEPQISDSGNYTCRASNTEPASIYVYVSKGKVTNFKYFETRNWKFSFKISWEVFRRRQTSF